ncbi:MAG TPA: amidase family protein [Acidimicrobiales bacterium]|nr:amidase family protein [Acidimicrobiales bacterium]
MGASDAGDVNGGGAERGGVPRDPHPASADIAALDATALSGLFDAGELTAAGVVEQLVARIEVIDGGGAGTHAVIELAPDALEVAATLDAERRAGRRRGPLHGVPVLVKDNVDTVAPLHTSAGSLVFGASSPATDATLVKVLREAGAIVIGKANLSEWANFRSEMSSSGWSARGGQTRNPHALDRSPGGSSAGSGAAVAARLVPLAVGTETDGSILCPAAACGVAGLKPTLGLVSRTGIVPIAATQDTAGPLARSVRDLGLLLGVLADAVDDGEDAAARRAGRPAGFDPAAWAQQGADGIAGLRIGVVRDGGYAGYHRPTDEAFGVALDALREVGAEIVDPVEGLGPPSTWEEDELTVLLYEFRAGMEAYLGRRADATPGHPDLPRTLADILDHAGREPRERADRFDTELIARAAATDGLGADLYLAALDRIKRATRTDGLDTVFAAGVDLVAVPAMSPAWPIDHVLGDHVAGAGWSPAAVAGYPSAALPVGTVGGLPVSIALLGPPWSEPLLLGALAALESALGSAITAPVPAFVGSLSLDR